MLVVESLTGGPPIPAISRVARSPGRAVATAAVLVGLLTAGTATACRSDDDNAGSRTTTEHSAMPADTPPTRAPGTPLPEITPTPRQMDWLGPDVDVPRQVRLTADDELDGATRDLLDTIVDGAGARMTTEGGSGSGDGTLEVRAGILSAGGATGSGGGGDDEGSVERALRGAGVEVPADLPAEGYALAVTPDQVVLAGTDGDGLYYAAQTLRQLVRDGTIAGVSVVDHPSMSHRGVIEGFYGSPWTLDERLDQLRFYGDMKLNTYIYAPKDDPFHRDRWREPYPADALAGLQQLIDAARARHVRFTFAVSPGVSICYSNPTDVDLLAAKLAALYDQGVRDFAVALDDIDHLRWNCDGDQARYGPPSDEAAARAQADLLNTLQQQFVASHEGTRPLVLVPTEYRGTDDSPYSSALRQQLDPAVEVMWTGRYVVPAEVPADHAAAAQARFGRPVFLWDNYPVNDYPRTTGRLLLAPYARRATNLDQHVTGVAANPMNQAAASKVALVGVADFTWNTASYDPGRAHRAAATYLAAAGGATSDGAAGDESADADDSSGDTDANAATVEALLAFFDLENFVPTSAAREDVIGQPQAPVLAGRLDTFRARWSGGDRSGAVDELRPYADLLAAAPERIRQGVADEGFVADCGPWLDALALWGQAFVATLDGLSARASGDEATAASSFAQAATLSGQANTIQTIPGETLPQGPVRVGDGVLDTFVAEAPTL